MKSIVFTYPGFQALPRGIKQLLVTSESIFFKESRPVNLAGRINQRHSHVPFHPFGNTFGHTLTVKAM